MDFAKNLQRLLGIGHETSYERRFVRPRCVLLIPWTCIPCGGYDGLVVGKSALFDNHLMRKRAVRSFVHIHPNDLAGWTLGRDIGSVVFVEDVGGEQLQMLKRKL